MTDPSYMQSPAHLMAAALEVAARLEAAVVDDSTWPLALSRDEAFILTSVLQGFGDAMRLAAAMGQTPQ